MIPLHIDPVSGMVTTKALLDRESKSLYTLILVARDQGTPTQQATRMLQVVVKDIDDHPSQFIRTPVGFHFSSYSFDAFRSFGRFGFLTSIAQVTLIVHLTDPFSTSTSTSPVAVYPQSGIHFVLFI